MRKTVLYRDGLIFFVITAILFMGAAAREVNLLLFLASLMASLLFLDRFWGSFSLRRLKVRRSLPTIIHAGDSFIVTLILHNRRRRGSSWSVLIEDTIVPDHDVYVNTPFVKLGWSGTQFRPSCYFESVKPGERLRKTYAGQLPMRGYYSFRTLTLSTRFPLGFFRCLKFQDAADSILVYPKVGRLSRHWLQQFRLRAEEQNRSRHRTSRMSDEMFGIRLWQSGDVRKWIDWRASAKHQKLLVRQFEERQNQDVAMVLDLPPVQNGEIDLTDLFENRELAISFTATLVKELGRSTIGSFSFAADFSTSSSSDVFPLPTGEVMAGKISLAFLRGVMDRLALIQPSNEDHLETVLSELFQKLHTATNIVLVTTGPLDLLSSDRLARLREERQWNRYLSRITVIDTSDPEFDSLYSAMT